MDKLDSINTHKEDVENIAAELVSWKNSKDRKTSSLKKDLSHTMRNKSYLAKKPPLNLKKLSRILKIDPEKMTVLLEPYVTQEELVRATAPFGLVAPVVAEFKKITFGGGIMGASLESSSHAWGQMNDTALAYELLLGDGSIIKASPQENADLFYGISGSYGSIATLLSIELPLIPAKKYVKVKIKTFTNVLAAVEALKNLCHADHPPEYIEGIVYNKNLVKVILAEMTEEDSLPLYSLSSTSAEWFHSKVFHSNEPFRMTLYDYLFRYDRGAFWMGTYAKWPALLYRFICEDTFLLPTFFLNKLKKTSPGKYNQPRYPGKWFRKIGAWAMASASLYGWLHWKKENWFEKNFVIQDFYLPEDRAAEFIIHVLDMTEINPLWICPCRATATPQIFSPHLQPEESLLFDVGVYGWPKEPLGSIEATEKLEKLTDSLHGKKMFYSWNYLTKAEISQRYNLNSYQKLRQKAFSEGVAPSFFEKTDIK